MNQLQIEHLRDFAIEHLPRAQSDRDQVTQYGLTEGDFYRRLFHTAVMVRSMASTTAIERAAANVLETVSLLCSEHEEPLSKPQRSNQLAILAARTKELCTLTGQEIDWLNQLPTTAEAEPEDEPPAPAIQKLPIHLAGRYLTTKEAAEALGVREGTLRTWAHNEKGALLPDGKVGRQNRYSGDAILEILTSRRTKTKRGK